MRMFRRRGFSLVFERMRTAVPELLNIEHRVQNRGSVAFAELMVNAVEGRLLVAEPLVRVVATGARLRVVR
jgi:hypothetical protein